MTKIRILFDYQAFEMQSRGGVFRYIYELMRNLYNDERLECSMAPRILIQYLRLAQHSCGIGFFSRGRGILGKGQINRNTK